MVFDSSPRHCDAMACSIKPSPEVKGIAVRLDGGLFSKNAFQGTGPVLLVPSIPARILMTKDSIDLGLAVLHSLHGGKRFTIEQIADACDCTPRAVVQLQARALKKVRKKLRELGIDNFDAPIVR